MSCDFVPFLLSLHSYYVLPPFLLSFQFCSIWSHSRFTQRWGILTCKEDKIVSRLSQPLLWTAAHSPGTPPWHDQTCCPRKTATPQNSIMAAPAQEERTGYGCGTRTGCQRLFPILPISQVMFFLYSTENSNPGKITMHLECFYYQWKCIKHLPHSDSFPTLEHILLWSAYIPSQQTVKNTHFLSRSQRTNPELDKTLALHEIFV